MNITITQIIITFFLLFALSRVYLRFKGGEVTLFGFFFWTILFGSAMLVVLYPGLSSDFAKALGIGRGADAIVYASIILLFYLVFRLYVYIQDIRYEITELVKKLALKENQTKKGKSPSYHAK